MSYVFIKEDMHMQISLKPRAAFGAVGIKVDRIFPGCDGTYGMLPDNRNIRIGSFKLLTVVDNEVSGQTERSTHIHNKGCLTLIKAMHVDYG